MFSFRLFDRCSKFHKFFADFSGIFRKGDPYRFSSLYKNSSFFIAKLVDLETVILDNVVGLFFSCSDGSADECGSIVTGLEENVFLVVFEGIPPLKV